MAGREAKCPNCGEPLQGPYCYICGQSQKETRRFFLTLLGDLFDDVFTPDGRTARTLFSLLFRPGRLTLEYSAGRRARYLPPIRLYLVTSFLFFLFLSISSALEGPLRIQNNLVVHDTGSPDATRDIILGRPPPAQETAKPEVSHAPGAGATADVPDVSITNTADASEDAELVQGFDEAATRLKIDILSDSANDRARELVRAQGKKVARLLKEDPGALLSRLIDMIPPIMFVLLPLFALLLKLAYLGSGRYYVEHLILALHTHSFIFFVLLVRRLLEFTDGLPYIGVTAQWIGIGIDIWIPLYLYLTLRNYFDQGTGVTLGKFLLLGFLYLALFIVIIPFGMVWGFLTL